MYMVICARGKGTRTHTRELARTILIQQYCVYNTVGTQYNITVAAVRSVIIYDNDAGPSENREWVYIILLLLFVIEYNIRIVYRAQDVILIEYYRFPWYALHRAPVRTSRDRDRQSPRRFPDRIRFASFSRVPGTGVCLRIRIRKIRY